MKKLCKVLAVGLACATITFTFAFVGCSNSGGGDGGNSAGNNTSDSGNTNQPTSVVLSVNSVSLFVGDTYKLYATVSPSSANQEVNWSSVNSACASVNSSGLITCKTVGTTVIRAETVNGIIATCTVNVSSAVGKVEGNITYQTSITGEYYNDHQAVVQLIPKNLSEFPTDYSLAKSYSNECGIYGTYADSDGHYSLDNIPVGEYRLVIRSENARRSSEERLAIMQGENTEPIKRLFGGLLEKFEQLKDTVAFGNYSVYDSVVNTYISYYFTTGFDISIQNGKTVLQDASFLNRR